MNKLPEVVLGRLFYVEYQPSLALIELLRLSKGEWVLEGLHGPANALEPEETVRVIVAALSNAGILIPMGFAETAEHGSAALLLGLSDFDRHWANVFMR